MSHESNKNLINGQPIEWVRLALSLIAKSNTKKGRVVIDPSLFSSIEEWEFRVRTSSSHAGVKNQIHNWVQILAKMIQFSLEQLPSQFKSGADAPNFLPLFRSDLILGLTWENIPLSSEFFSVCDGSTVTKKQMTDAATTDAATTYAATDDAATDEKKGKGKGGKKAKK